MKENEFHKCFQEHACHISPQHNKKRYYIKNELHFEDQ